MEDLSIFLNELISWWQTLDTRGFPYYGGSDAEKL